MNKKVRFFSSVLGAVMACGVILPTAAACGDETATSKKRDSMVIMTEELTGLFNPFYATSGADMDVVGMTQLAMLSTDYDPTAEKVEDRVKVVVGENEPTAVLAYSDIPAEDESKTVYTFVLKNDLKFSDGKPLTMNDVMFNIYEYLDPVYTGSSTMYSIDIQGLTQYRTQTNFSGETGGTEDDISEDARAYAVARIDELINVYKDNGETETGSYYLDEADMKEAISKHNVTPGFKNAVATKSEQADMLDADYRKILLADYNLALTEFKKELETDFLSAKEAYDLNTAPYSDWKKEFSNDVFKFFYMEGKIKPEYEEKPGGGYNRAKITGFDYQIGHGFDDVKAYTKEQAIAAVYKDTINEELLNVLSYWGTATTLLTNFQAKAKDILIKNNMKDGQKVIPNISGVVSLGHTSDVANVTVNGKEYVVAHEHNEDGTPKNENEYDVLQITINGIDPKAIYSFGFSVAPAHYYTEDSEHPNGRKIDIANNEFGVEFSDSDFQTYVIQSQKHVEVPVGAGAYMATNDDNKNNPTGSEFWSSNIVYYKRNPNFMFEVKEEKMRMQVVSASNALDKLANGEVDFVTPQYTNDNAERLDKLASKGFKSLSAWQLGYGYIGINAGKVENIYLRRAIMAAMDVELATNYYRPGESKTIKWPMSTVSWAYPYEDDGAEKIPTDKGYLLWEGEDKAKAKIKNYMDQAKRHNATTAAKLKYTFTIAGAAITEHPTYQVFTKAAELLNECGWQVEVTPDSQALTKLATGSLEVWAAAWGSSLDPDMYQIYHRNSTATSTYAWGYREIKSNTSLYKLEDSIITALSVKIDEGRNTLDRQERTRIYEEAMELVLDLAVEMPVYQRKTLYAFNSKRLTGINESVNPYTSPLEEIWNIELVK